MTVCMENPKESVRVTKKYKTQQCLHTSKEKLEIEI